MKQLKPLVLDWKIAVSIALCMLTYYFVPQLQLLAACTSALMCAQDTAKISWKSSMTRVTVTLIGGVFGLLIVLADNVIQNSLIFILLSVAGVLLTLIGCRMLKVPPIAGRIGVITFILVVVVATGDYRITYAVQRVIATIYGALVSVGVSWAFGLAAGRKAAAK